jgi:hypothetical protein
MKKQTIVPTLATPAKTISDKKASNYALRTLGMHFTGKFILAEGNPKIKEFRDDAESCLEKVTSRNKTKRWLGFWVLIAVLLTGVAVQQCFEHSWLVLLNDWVAPTSLIGAMFAAFIGFMFYGSNLGRWNRPGDTTKLVAKAWRPLRKQLIAAGVVDSLSWSIQNATNGTPLFREIEGWRFGGQELEKLLGNKLESMAHEAARNFHSAELDGCKRDQKRYRTQFYVIDNLGQKLGFEKLNWDMLNR